MGGRKMRGWIRVNDFLTPRGWRLINGLALVHAEYRCMNARDFLQLGVFLAALAAVAPLLGAYLARVYQGEAHFAQRLLGPAERAIYRLGGISPEQEMSWREYAWALLVFNLAGILLLLAVQLTQRWLPLNPAALPNVPFAPRAEYRGVVHDEHELAGLFRRERR